MITTTRPGLFTTVQDEGRWGFQAFGMPVAGVMDRYAYRVANMLVGNKPGAAVLEMTLQGGSFRIEQDCYLAVCGADMQGKLNGVPINNWTSFFAAAGSELDFNYAVTGCRTYVAFRGGIDTPCVLGSRSTYTRGGIGGIDGRALKAGDVLKLGTAFAQPAQARALPSRFIPCYQEEIELSVLLGPQDDYFTSAGIHTFFNSIYTISSEADRMGYRMEGAVIEHKDKADIVSDALCQGAIQVPGHGMPIIMMADRQTTGGYTKIGTVIGPDLMLLAQAKPGDRVRFRQCTIEEAEAALKAEQECYKQVSASLTASQHTQLGLAKQLRITVNKEVYNVELREVATK